MEWNEDTISRLRGFWADGHSTAEIGRRMSVSKNAVVGKAHRLGLAARPSPIRRDGAGPHAARAPHPRRSVGPTLPPLAAAPMPSSPVPNERARTARRATPAAEAASADLAEGETHVVATATAPSAPAAPPIPVRPVPPPRAARQMACCWPLGEPGTKSFRFCDEDAAAGKPYCAAHAQLAYVKVRDRREEAA